MRKDLASTLLALACACAAACGGGGSAASSQSTHRGPLIAGPVADALAAQAKMVVASLDAGHGCAARTQAHALAGAVDAAIAAGQIPAALQPQLHATTASLGAAITCTPPPPKPPKPPDHRPHPGHDKKHGQGD